MNVYQMIEGGAFDTAGGFWVKRNNWGNTVALITEYDEFIGLPPYFNNPIVRCDIFYDRGSSGVRYKKNESLSCPGTSAYTRINPPSWWISGKHCDDYAAKS